MNYYSVSDSADEFFNGTRPQTFIRRYRHVLQTPFVQQHATPLSETSSPWYIHYRINTRCNYRRICPFVPGNFFFLSTIIIYPSIFLNISKGFLFERIFPRASFNMGDLPSNLKFNWKIHFLFSLFSCKYRTRITFSINTSTCYFPMISNSLSVISYYFYYLKRENDTNRLDYPKMFNIRNSRVEDRRLFREGTRGYPRAW